MIVRVPVRVYSEANVGGKFRDALKRKKQYKAALVAAVIDAGHQVMPALIMRGGKNRATAKLAYQPAFPLEVTFTRIAPNMLDDDNLARAFKAMRDQFSDLIDVDDRDPRVEWRYNQRREGVRIYAFEVEWKTLITVKVPHGR